ncbi:hypothetical protein SLA2020_078310 [Shorea laevis]
MVRAGKFLVPLRQSISLITSSCFLVPRSRHSIDGKGGSLKKWVRSFEHVMNSRASTLNCRVNIQRKFVQDFCSSGNRGRGSIFGVSVLFGSIYFWPHVVHAMDGHDVLMEEPDVEFLSALDVEEHLNILSRFMRKFWLPVFLIFCVFVNRNNPITLVTEIIFFLLGTKPSSFSIYLFVDRLCRQLMCQEPHLYRLKSLCASKVEVQDYYLFCLARVEVRDQKLNLAGILGGWWPLPSSIYFPSSLVFQNIVQIPSIHIAANSEWVILGFST